MLEHAIEIAIEAHRGQLDKAGKPYILHPLRVMLAGKTLDEMICGVLHDVIEDTPVSLSMLALEGYPPHIIHALDLLSKHPHEDYFDFIHRMQTDPLAMRVKLNDLHDNLNRDRLGDLTSHDLARMEKYHKAEAILLNRLASLEYDSTHS